MITALFVRKRSIYKKLGVDSYDLQRNALTYTGSNPVICHPPCRLWSKMRGLSNAPESEKQTGLFAVWTVQLNGGILEHPERSQLWTEAALPPPGTIDHYGGYTISIDQSWYGHRARKRTYLYIVGIDQKDLPPIAYSLDVPTHTISKPIRRNKNSVIKKQVNKTEREATPQRLAKWLIQTALKIALNKQKTAQLTNPYSDEKRPSF